MTRITTISSGLAGVGKTHVAVNLALEMVRRGRQAALFNQTSSHSSIDDLLILPQTGILQRRSTDQGDSLVRRGYQGVDIISSGVPLSQWGTAPAQVVQKIVNDMDITDGYDDFLIDTSGLDPRTQLLCCRISSLLVLIITPDFRSRAEAFALLRILQLNGFDGEVCLLVNRLEQSVDAHELHDSFNQKLKKYLGLDVPLLGMLVNDARVQRAEHSQQAFSSLFPEAEVSGQIVAMVDAVDVIPAVQQAVVNCWSSFREKIGLPVLLAGGALLEVLDDQDDVAVRPLQKNRESGKEVMLLQLETSFHALPGTLDMLPGLLHAAADDVSNLQCLFEKDDNPAIKEEIYRSQDSGDLLRSAVYLVREIEQCVVPVQLLQLQVKESRVSGDDVDWLQAGCYLKYVFRFPDQERILSLIESALAEASVFKREGGQAGETIWEKVAMDRRGGMNIIHTPDDSIRIQVWLLPGKRPNPYRGDKREADDAVLAPSRTIH